MPKTLKKSGYPAEDLLARMFRVGKLRLLQELDRIPVRITGMQYGILNALRDRPGGATITEIAETFGVEPPTLVAPIHQLARKKLLVKTRDERDRRRMPLAITPAGESLVAKLVSPASSALRRALKEAGPAKAAAFLAILSRTVEQCEKDWRASLVNRHKSSKH